MRKARILVIFVVVLAAILAAGWRYGGWFQGGDGQLTLYGNVDIRQVDLAFDAEGRVTGMRVQEGDHVKAGAELATLDATTYQSLYDLAVARAEAQRQEVTKLKAGSRPEEIARDRANVAAYEAVLFNAQRVMDRRQTLLGQGFAAQQQYEEAQATARQTENLLEAARQTLKLSEEGPRVEDIAAAEAQLRAAEASVAAAKDRLDHCRLLAPSDGIILSRNVEPGAVILPTTAAYTLALTSEIWVRSFLPETALTHIQPGDIFIITVDSAPEKQYQAKIGFISPTAEFTPKTVETPELRTQLVYRIRLKVQGDAPDLRQGMPVTLRPQKPVPQN
jgi:HlyD family secretion protein